MLGRIIVLYYFPLLSKDRDHLVSKIKPVGRVSNDNGETFGKK